MSPRSGINIQYSTVKKSSAGTAYPRLSNELLYEIETKDEENPSDKDDTRTSNVPCSNNLCRDITSYSKVRHSLGKIDVECRHCGALHLILRSEPFLLRGMTKWLQQMK
ncbi:hypothetical protein MKW92_008454 [Papaver armeniacum]|nr:hypothetical protein MKW92_008454 [Papaver armeniacum]